MSAHEAAAVYTIAFRLFTADRHADAIPILLRHLARHPQDPMAYELLATAYQGSSDAQTARAAAEKAVALAPGRAQAYVVLASAIALGAPGGEIPRGSRGPPTPTPRLNRTCAKRSGSTPTHGPAAHDLAALLLRRSRYAEALSVVEQAIRHHPERVALHNHRTLALAGVGRTDESVTSAAAALRLEPTSADALRYAAASQIEAGRYADARALAREALRLEPTRLEGQRLFAEADERARPTRGLWRFLCRRFYPPLPWVLLMAGGTAASLLFLWQAIR